MINTSLINKNYFLFINAKNNLLRTSFRSFIVIFCLTSFLTPFVVAVSISEGIKMQYKNILNQGADIYIARDNYGSNAPIELKIIKQLELIQGVVNVVPRIIGRTYFKQKFVSVLGLPLNYIPSSIKIIEGRLPDNKNEVILGYKAARYSNLTTGSQFSIPKYSNQVFVITGLFKSSFSIWNADLMIMNYSDASNLFAIKDKATDILIYTRPGYDQIVEKIITIMDQDDKKDLPPLRIQTRSLIQHYSQRGFNIKAGVFSGFYFLVLLVGIPCIGIISGYSLSERKREIGIMKAIGWQTQEILQMAALENLILSSVSIIIIIILSSFWIHSLNCAFIAEFFIASLNIIIPFKIPSKIFPVPLVLCIILTIVLTMVGTIYTTWKTAIITPFEAMRT